MSYACEDTAAGEACAAGNDTGIAYYYNSSCNICCEPSTFLVMDFKPPFACENGAVLWGKTIAFASMFGVLLLPILVLLYRRWSGDKLRSVPILVLALIATLFGIADNLVTLFRNRLSVDSWATFFLLFAAIGVLNLFVHMNGVAQKAKLLPDGEQGGGKTEYARLDKKTASALVLTKTFWVCVLLIAVETGVNAALLVHLPLWSSWNVFVTAFAFYLGNLAVIFAAQVMAGKGCKTLYLFPDAAVITAGIVVSAVLSSQIAADSIFAAYAVWSIGVAFLIALS